jgi:hypothetical protein
MKICEKSDMHLNLSKVESGDRERRGHRCAQRLGHGRDVLVGGLVLGEPRAPSMNRNQLKSIPTD